MANQKEQKTEGKKHPGGRPTKYKPEHIQVAEDLCRKEGYTDKQLAAHFKVAECTLYSWKKEYPEFSEVIRRGKDDFDNRVVESSLLKRAVGYTYEEITQEPCVVNARAWERKSTR